MVDKEQVHHVVLGKVVRKKMDKTVTVVVERLVAHSLYGKIVKRTTKLLVHDEHNKANEGDTVLISPCRPISKRKKWIIESIR